MGIKGLKMRVFGTAMAVVGMFALSSCESLDQLPPAPVAQAGKELNVEYRIGSGDNLEIFVWRNSELSSSVPVRPDGKITVPLIEDLPATGRTPTQLARDIEKALATYIQDPIVTVIVRGFQGPFEDRVRVVGEATSPQTLAYNSTMTLLDVMIAVGGLTDFADGNRATISRVVDGSQKQYRVRLDDLLRNGDLTANVEIKPGDVVVIPEAWF